MAAGKPTHNRIKLIVLLIFACFLAAAALWNSAAFAKLNDTPASPRAAVQTQLQTQLVPAKPDDAPMEGCLKCHNNIEPMHKYNSSGDVYDTLKKGKDAQDLSCTSCHGGNPAATTQREAHVQPLYPKEWGCKNGECSSRNPERTNTLLAKESRDFVRFINPGDFRVIGQTCGTCHAEEVRRSPRSMMAHGAMLWGAALYNNGGYPIKDAAF